MKRRLVLFGLGVAMAGLLVPSAMTASAAAKDATITLEVSGMT